MSIQQFPATKWLLGAIVCVYFMVELTGSTDSVRHLLVWGALAGPLVMDGEYWRLVTALFLHGGLLHLAFNGFALYQLGPICEVLFGRVPFLGFFFVCGIGSSLLSMTMHPRTISVGASGAIFGLAGLLLAFAYSHRSILTTHFRRSMLHGLAPFVLYNLVFGMIVPQIDNWGHVGGLLTGGVLGFVVQPKGNAQ